MIINPTFAQTFVSKKNGSWNVTGTWNIETGCNENPSKNTPPFTKDWGCAVDVLIQNHVSSTMDIANFGKGMVNGLKILSVGSLTVAGDFEFPGNGWGYSALFRNGGGGNIGCIRHI